MVELKDRKVVEGGEVDCSCQREAEVELKNGFQLAFRGREFSRSIQATNENCGYVAGCVADDSFDIQFPVQKPRLNAAPICKSAASPTRNADLPLQRCTAILSLPIHSQFMYSSKQHGA